jgi:hypothetical protein
MALRHASLAVLLLVFALSLLTLITSVKYAEWARHSIKAAGSAVLVTSIAFYCCNTLLTDTDRPLIFYSGTVPVLSLVQTTLQIACLHLSAYLPPVFFLIIAATGSLAWALQASIWATCELSGGLPAPGKRVITPQWCPQYAFKNHGGDLSAALTIFKTTLAWIMLLAYLAMAVLAFLNMRQISGGERVDVFYELEEIQPLTPRRAKTKEAAREAVREVREFREARPYSTKFKFVSPDNGPAIQILPISNRP